MATEKLIELVSRYLQSLLDEYHFSVNERLLDDHRVEYRSDRYNLLFVVERGPQVGIYVGINGPELPRYNLRLIDGFITHFRPDWTFSGTTEEQFERLSKLLLHYADFISKQDLLTNQAEELKAYTEKWTGTPPWSLNDWRAKHGYTWWRRWFRRWFKERI